MAFFNCFTNFNINFIQPNFGFNFGCFSMPNFFQNMPFFNCFSNFIPFNSFNSFSPNSWQQYTSPIMYNMPSLFNSATNFAMPNTSFVNSFNNYNFNNSWNNSFYGAGFDTFISSNSLSASSSAATRSSSNSTAIQRNYGSLQEQLYKTGLSFVGNINSDREGNKRFSNGRSNQWCADFVSTLVHETFGDKLPTGFPDARRHATSVMSIKNWGEKHNRYLDLPSSGISDFIAKNVKPGDIMIISRGGGKGHAAIVTKVNNDGTFETVGGNESNSVKNKKRQPTSKQGKQTLIGFVQMGDIA